MTARIWAAALALSACEAGRPPELTGAAPGLICEDSAAVLTIEGERLDAALTDALSGSPELRLPTLALARTGTLSGADDGDPINVPIADDQVTWVDRGHLELSLNDQLGLISGRWDLVLTDAFGRSSRLEDALLIAGAPTVAGLEPDQVCNDLQESSLTVTGQDFLVLDGALPSAQLDFQQAQVLSAEDCTPLPGGQGQVCSTLELQIDPTLLADGAAQLLVNNPSPMDCLTSAPALLQVEPPPVLDAIEPQQLCELGGAFTLTGAGFVEGSTVSVGGLAADAVIEHEGEILVQLPDGLEPGLHDVEVQAPDGCVGVLEEALRVTGPPLLYFVDPPVVFGGVDVEVTAYVADVSGAITDAWLESAQTGAVAQVDWSWDQAEPGLLHAVLPRTVPAGEHYLRYTQDGDCQGDVGGTVRVRALTPVAVDAVEPPYAWTFDHTPIVVTADDPIPNGQVGFGDTPRLYLQGPNDHPGTTQLLGVTFESEQRLTAVVPPGLDPGTYKLLVVNPDEGIGYLRQALRVTFEGPPQIRTVSPGTLPNSGNQPLIIHGRDFRDPSVTLDCLDGNAPVTLNATIDSSGYARIAARVPTNMVNNGVCLVTVTNGDGTYSSYSAVSITNPSQNLFPWQTGTEMVEARRAPAAAAGRVSPVDRFVYALGGDEGDISTAKSSVEVARIGLYGDMGEWTLLPSSLPSVRTLSGVTVIGRFVYLVGGHNLSQPLASVFRAQILDPLNVPGFSGLTLSGGGNSGLSAGTWTYRVAALYDASDLMNPSGETLASDPITLTLPDVGEPLRPTLSWEEVDRAVGYRVYRSPSADLGAGSEQWLADVSTNSFTDRGDATSEDHVIQPVGALGEWARLPVLTDPRESPCVAIGWDPNPDPERVYIYAAGGRDVSGQPLNTVDVLDIAIVSDDIQVAGSWRRLPERLDTARYQCSGFTVDTREHTVVNHDETWVYFAGGLTGNGATGETMAGQVGPNGSISDWQQISALSPARAGFSFASASNFLYAFGGQSGSPSRTGTSAELTEQLMPDVRNWNSLSTALGERRYLPGSAQESAVIFVLGGETNQDSATHTTDFTNF